MTNVNLHAPEYKDAESKVMFFCFFTSFREKASDAVFNVKPSVTYVALFSTLRLNANINKKFALHNYTWHMDLNFKRGVLQIKVENAFS